MRLLVFYARKDRNGPPSVNQVISTDKPRRGHAVCTLQLHPPTSPYPTLSAEAEPVSKDMPEGTSETESLVMLIGTMGPKGFNEKKSILATYQLVPVSQKLKVGLKD